MDHWNDENNPESGIADPVFPSHDIQASEDRAKTTYVSSYGIVWTKMCIRDSG